MERARTEFLRARGFGKETIIGDEAMFVVQTANVDYRRPATLDDETYSIREAASRTDTS